jgi:hypothetical protein
LHGSQLLTAIDLPGLSDSGPSDLRALLTTSFVLVTAGMVIGVLGHLTQLKPVVAAGVALVFGGAAFFVIAVGQFG